MNQIIDAIIHTIAFYDAVGKVPLTKLELYKYLINMPAPPAGGFGSFLKILDREWPSLEPYIERERGFYSLKKNRSGYARRIHIGKTGIKKWRIAKRMIRLISFLPYVRMVAITGSLALNNTHKESDIDVLITAKHGHIWTVRILVTALMQILGKRRHGKKISDRICLNHYISDKSRDLRPKNLFSDHISKTMIPMRSLAKEGLLEKLLTYTVAGPLESFLRAVQIRKIKHRQVIFEDSALVFHHPRPQNQEALYLYKQNLSTIYPHIDT
jgi:predicted nucleotidyltransferase